MRITYDRDADALYIALREDVPADHSVDVEGCVVADVDAQGHIIGMEVLGAKARLGGEPPASITVEVLSGADDDEIVELPEVTASA